MILSTYSQALYHCRATNIANSFEISNNLVGIFQLPHHFGKRFTLLSILCLLHFLHVNGAHYFLAICNRGFFKCLTTSQFFDNAGFLKFSFEFFECFFDVFAFFYRYYYHIFCLLMFPSTNCGAKLKHCFLINKPFTDIFLSKRVFLHYQA